MGAPLHIELERHAAALRALARQLVGEQRADDLVQDVALQALETPRPPAGWRGWLQVVLRRRASNLRRDERRRQRREGSAAAARSFEVSSSAAVAAQQELVRAVTEQLLALPEPYRDTLFRRFFHDATPTAIAATTGVPLATVRSRLQRGLAQLRERLDHEFGERERWSAPLLCLTGAPSGLVATAATSFTFAGLLMKTQLIVGGAVLMLAALAVSLTWQPENAPAPAATAAVPQLQAGSPGHDTDTVAPPLERTAVAADTAAAPVGPAQGSVVVRVRCIDANGNPVPGCEVRLQAAAPLQPEAELRTQTRSGVDGRVVLTLVPAAVAYELLVHKDGLVPMRHAWIELQPGSTYDLGDAILVTGGGVAGRVIDPRGVPQVGVPVRFYSANGIPESAEGQLLPTATADAVTGPDGSFEARGPLAPGDWTAALMPPYQTSGLSGIPVERRAFTITAGRITSGVDLTCSVATAMLRGQVVAPDGAPIAGAELTRSVGIALLPTTRTDAMGQFAIPRFEGDDARSTRLKIKATGFEPTETGNLEFDAQLKPIVLQRSPDATIEVVEDDSGAAVAAFGLGIAQYPGSRNGPWIQLAWPCLLRPHGQIKVTGLPRGRYLAWVTPREPRLAAFLADFTVEAEGIHCQLRAPRLGARLLRVVTGSGQPVAGSRVELVLGVMPPAVTLTSEVHLPRDLAGLGAVLLQRSDTDAAGEVTLRGPVGAPFVLRLLGPGHRPSVIADVRLDDGLEPLVAQVDIGATVFGKLTPARALAELGPSPRELQAAASLGDRGGAMLQSMRPQVLLRPMGGGAAVYPEEPSEGAVAADGSFRIEGVPDGSWQVCVRFRLPGLCRGSGVARVAELATVRDLRCNDERRVELDCSGLGTGNLQALVLVDGDPLVNGKVQLLYRHAGLQWGDREVAEAAVRTATDTEGRLTADLPPGDWALSVSVPGRNGGEATLRNEQFAVVRAGGATSITYAMQRRTLRAHILRADGAPEVGRSFLVLQEHYLKSAGKTDDAGWLQIDSVIPGSFELVSWPNALTGQKAQSAYIKEHPYPQWLDALIRLGPVSMPAGQTRAEVELRLPN